MHEKPAIFRSSFNASKLSDAKLDLIVFAILQEHGISVNAATCGQVDEVTARLRFAGF